MGPSGEVCVNFLISGTFYNKLVFLTKVDSPATIVVNHTKAIISHCGSLPFVVCVNFCIKITKYEKYIMDMLSEVLNKRSPCLPPLCPLLVSSRL